MSSIELKESGVQSPNEMLARVAQIKLCLSVPNEGLTSRGLVNLLRLFEILVFFRSISPNGHLADEWHVQYREFLQLFSGSPKNAETQNLRSQHGARSTMFEQWMKKYLGDRSLLAIENIERGSYEFIFNVANLVAIFGFQDYGILKDVMQWAATSLQSILQDSMPRERSMAAEASEPVTAETLYSGTGVAITLTPELVKTIGLYDQVKFSVREQGDTRTFLLSLSRFESNSSMSTRIGNELPPSKNEGNGLYRAIVRVPPIGGAPPELT